MNDTDLRVRDLLATHLNASRESVDADTQIGIRSFPNSVRYHRFWAALEELTGKRIDPKSVRSFGSLVATLDGQGDAVPQTLSAAPHSRGRALGAAAAVGIDIQDITEFPLPADYRTDPFYARLFSAKEIAASLLGDDPRASLAGRYCAKEAIVKASGGISGIDLQGIEILADEDGAPQYDGFAISISHSGNFAVAVAVRTADA